MRELPSVTIKFQPATNIGPAMNLFKNANYTLTPPVIFQDREFTDGTEGFGSTFSE